MDNPSQQRSALESVAALLASWLSSNGIDPRAVVVTFTHRLGDAEAVERAMHADLAPFFPMGPPMVEQGARIGPLTFVLTK